MNPMLLPFLIEGTRLYLFHLNGMGIKKKKKKKTKQILELKGFNFHDWVLR